MVLRPSTFTRLGLHKLPSRIQRQMINFSTTAIRRVEKSDCSGENEEPVLFECLEGGKGLIVLNRPKQLNTLNYEMVCKIRETLIAWKEDKYLIGIKGAGEKAFCAGGDVVAVTKDTTGETGKKFFREEYKMDALIACLSVPYVAFIRGIVMGGGVGISIFGKFRVATETSMFAMPETQIGFFPDVGVSHKLACMPNRLGQFLALTGYRLKGYDLVHAGIATHFCADKKIDELKHALFNDFSKGISSSPEEILKEFQDESTKGAPPEFTLAKNLECIESWFSSCSIEDAIGKICQDNSPFAQETKEMLGKMSPLSLKVTYRQIQEASKLCINECFNVDYRIACRMLKYGDFVEGVRALLIDKDKCPKWKHDSVEKVTKDEVDCFFSPMPEGELNLPSTLYDPCCE